MATAVSWLAVRYVTIKLRKRSFLISLILQLTWADIHVYHALTLVQKVLKSMNETLSFDKYPGIQALVAKVEGTPAIKAWIEKRPKTDY